MARDIEFLCEARARDLHRCVGEGDGKRHRWFLCEARARHIHRCVGEGDGKTSMIFVWGKGKGYLSMWETMAIHNDVFCEWQEQGQEIFIDVSWETMARDIDDLWVRQGLGIFTDDLREVVARYIKVLCAARALESIIKRYSLMFCVIEGRRFVNLSNSGCVWSFICFIDFSDPGRWWRATSPTKSFSKLRVPTIFISLCYWQCCSSASCQSATLSSGSGLPGIAARFQTTDTSTTCLRAVWRK